jgi:hypothetical protein
MNCEVETTRGRREVEAIAQPLQMLLWNELPYHNHEISLSWDPGSPMLSSLLLHFLPASDSSAAMVASACVASLELWECLRMRINTCLLFWLSRPVSYANSLLLNANSRGGAILAGGGLSTTGIRGAVGTTKPELILRTMNYCFVRS